MHAVGAPFHRAFSNAGRGSRATLLQLSTEAASAWAKVTNFCKQLHATLHKEFKYAVVWGTSAKHAALRAGLTHQLEDEDVVQVVKKKNVPTGEERGRFKTKSDAPDRIADRVKKAPLKS